MHRIRVVNGKIMIVGTGKGSHSGRLLLHVLFMLEPGISGCDYCEDCKSSAD